MLINLSNHPSSQWPSRQKAVSVKLFGEVRDIPFPKVDPLADEEYIFDLAKEYALKCMDIIKKSNVTGKENAVHIMGELTFCFSTVMLLQQKGITCLASTSVRQAAEKENGEKHSVFSFERFRKYPVIAGL